MWPWLLAACNGNLACSKWWVVTMLDNWNMSSGSVASQQETINVDLAINEYVDLLNIKCRYF